MSARDGYLKNDTLYVTNDIALAAYLLMRGFELLGAVDSGLKYKEFGLTHTDPEVLRDLKVAISTMADEYENMYLPLPHDANARVNFKVYQQKMRELHRALDEPVRRDV